MAISPTRGTSTRNRRDDQDRRHTSYRTDNNKDSPADRGRRRAREPDNDNDDDLVDYIHERDRLPRATLKHRETSREGKRRHEYRYYEPQTQRESRPAPRARSVDRHRSSTRREGRSSAGRDRDREREEDTYDRSIPRSARRMSMSGPARRGDDRREFTSNRRDHRPSGSNNNSSRRRASVSFDNRPTYDTTGKKRSQAQNLGKAAIAAGALEAVRQRGKGVDDRGAWKRVATAALGAAAIDAAATKVRGRDPREQGKKSTLGASLGGLMVEGLVHRIKT